MSDMHFREPNQVKWQGSRPGHNGTQILVGLEIAALNWSIVYTVPAGQKLFLTQAFLGVGGNATSAVYLGVYDDTPVLIHRLAGGWRQINQTWPGFHLNYWPPLELLAGYSIRYSQSVNTSIIVAIHGWTE